MAYYNGKEWVSSSTAVTSNDGETTTKDSSGTNVVQGSTDSTYAQEAAAEEQTTAEEVVEEEQEEPQEKVETETPELTSLDKNSALPYLTAVNILPKSWTEYNNSLSTFLDKKNEHLGEIVANKSNTAASVADDVETATDEGKQNLAKLSEVNLGKNADLQAEAAKTETTNLANTSSEISDTGFTSEELIDNWKIYQDAIKNGVAEEQQESYFHDQYGWSKDQLDAVIEAGKTLEENDGVIVNPETYDYYKEKYNEAVAAKVPEDQMVNEYGFTKTDLNILRKNDVQVTIPNTRENTEVLNSGVTEETINAIKQAEKEKALAAAGESGSTALGEVSLENTRNTNFLDEAVAGRIGTKTEAVDGEEISQSVDRTNDRTNEDFNYSGTWADVEGCVSAADRKNGFAFTGYISEDGAYIPSTVLWYEEDVKRIQDLSVKVTDATSNWKDEETMDYLMDASATLYADLMGLFQSDLLRDDLYSDLTVTAEEVKSYVQTAMNEVKDMYDSLAEYNAFYGLYDDHNLVDTSDRSHYLNGYTPEEIQDLYNWMKQETDVMLTDDVTDFVPSENYSIDEWMVIKTAMESPEMKEILSSSPQYSYLFSRTEGHDYKWGVPLTSAAYVIDGISNAITESQAIKDQLESYNNSILIGRDYVNFGTYKKDKEGNYVTDANGNYIQNTTEDIVEEYNKKLISLKETYTKLEQSGDKEAMEANLAQQKYINNTLGGYSELAIRKRISEANYTTEELQEKFDGLLWTPVTGDSSTPNYGKGNVDLNSIPLVKNEDGSYVTDYTTGVYYAGKKILIPTVIRVDGEWKHVDDKTAVAHYKETGEYLGIFDTEKEANEYAAQITLSQDKLYSEDIVEDNSSEIKSLLDEKEKLKEELDLNTPGAWQNYYDKVKEIDAKIKALNDGKVPTVTEKESEIEDPYANISETEKVINGYRTDQETGIVYKKISYNDLSATGKLEYEAFYDQLQASKAEDQSAWSADVLSKYENGRAAYNAQKEKVDKLESVLQEKGDAYQECEDVCLEEAGWKDSNVPNVDAAYDSSKYDSALDEYFSENCSEENYKAYKEAEALYNVAKDEYESEDTLLKGWYSDLRYSDIDKNEDYAEKVALGHQMFTEGNDGNGLFTNFIESNDFGFEDTSKEGLERFKYNFLNTTDPETGEYSEEVANQSIEDASNYFKALVSSAKYEGIGGVFYGMQTEAQRDNFYYILATDGLYAALEYAGRLNNIADENENAEYDARQQQIANGLFKYDTLAGVLTSATTPWVTNLMSVSSIPTTAKRIQQAVLTDGKYWSNAYDMQEKGDSVIEALSAVIASKSPKLPDSITVFGKEISLGPLAGKDASFLYNAYISGVNSAEWMAIGGMIAKGVTSVTGSTLQIGKNLLDVDKLITTGLTDTIFFGSAMSDDLVTRLESGEAYDKAILASLCTGVNEALYEHFSLDKLYDAKYVTDFKSWLTDTIIQMGIEGTEEVATNISNRFTDNFVSALTGEDRLSTEKIYEYISQGYTEDEARKLVWRDNAYEDVDAFASAMLSSSVSVGYRGGISGAQNAHFGSAVNGLVYNSESLKENTLTNRIAAFVNSYNFKATDENGRALMTSDQIETVQYLKEDASKVLSGDTSNATVGQMYQLFANTGTDVVEDFVLSDVTNAIQYMSIDAASVVSAVDASEKEFLGTNAYTIVEYISGNKSVDADTQLDAFTTYLDNVTGTLDSATSIKSTIKNAVQGRIDIDTFVSELKEGGTLSDKTMQRAVYSWLVQETNTNRNLINSGSVPNTTIVTREPLAEAGVYTDNEITGALVTAVRTISEEREKAKEVAAYHTVASWENERKAAEKKTLQEQEKNWTLTHILRDSKKTAEERKAAKEAKKKGTIPTKAQTEVSGDKANANLSFTSEQRNVADTVTRSSNGKTETFTRKDFVESYMKGKNIISGEKVNNPTEESANTVFDTLMRRSASKEYGDLWWSAEAKNFDLSKEVVSTEKTGEEGSKKKAPLFEAAETLFGKKVSEYTEKDFELLKATVAEIQQQLDEQLKDSQKTIINVDHLENLLKVASRCEAELRKLTSSEHEENRKKANKIRKRLDSVNNKIAAIKAYTGTRRDAKSVSDELAELNKQREDLISELSHYNFISTSLDKTFHGRFRIADEIDKLSAKIKALEEELKSIKEKNNARNSENGNRNERRPGDLDRLDKNGATETHGHFRVTEGQEIGSNGEEKTRAADDSVKGLLSGQGLKTDREIAYDTRGKSLSEILTDSKLTEEQKYEIVKALNLGINRVVLIDGEIYKPEYTDEIDEKTGEVTGQKERKSVTVSGVSITRTYDVPLKERDENGVNLRGTDAESVVVINAKDAKWQYHLNHETVHHMLSMLDSTSRAAFIASTLEYAVDRNERIYNQLVDIYSGIYANAYGYKLEKGKALPSDLLDLINEELICDLYAGIYRNAVGENRPDEEKEYVKSVYNHFSENIQYMFDHYHLSDYTSDKWLGRTGKTYPVDPTGFKNSRMPFGTKTSVVTKNRSVKFSTTADTVKEVEKVLYGETKGVTGMVSQLGENTRIDTDGNGHLLTASNKNTAMYSLTTYKNGGRESLVEALYRNGHTEDEVNTLVNQMDDAVDYLNLLAAYMAKEEGADALAKHLSKGAISILENGAGERDKYIKLGGNLVADITTNVKTGKQALSAFVNNGEYPVNIDLALICKKRVAYMNVMQTLIDDGFFDTIEYGSESIAAVNEILRNNGFETACLGCFVESRRLSFQNWANDIVTEWNEEVDKRVANPKNVSNFSDLDIHSLSEDDVLNLQTEFDAEGKKNDIGNHNLGQGSSRTRMGRLIDKNIAAAKNGKPSLIGHLRTADLLTPEGLKNIRSFDPDLFSLIVSRYGANSPKIVQEYNPYNSEIANLTFKFAKEITNHAIAGTKAFVDLAKEELGYPVKVPGESDAALKARRAEWNEHHTKLEIDELAVKKYLFSIGGARMQSFSDFMIENVFDYLQIFADLSARGLPMHGYTKEAICLRLFGLTGGKWNGSLIAHVDESKGKEMAGLLDASEADRGNAIRVEYGGKQYAISFDDYYRHNKIDSGSYIQSIGLRDILALQCDPRYADNVGSITVGLSDPMIVAMLDSDFFRMVIPYHSSGMNPEYAALMHIKSYNDYTDVQNTTVKQYYDLNGNEVTIKDLGGSDTMEVDEDGNEKKQKVAPKDITSFSFNSDLQKTGDARRTAANYIAWCNEKHVVYNGKKKVGYATYNPKFHTIKDANGKSVIENKNYYKLLEDFNVYNCITEDAARQTEVGFVLPNSNNRLTDEELAEYRQRLINTGVFKKKNGIGADGKAIYVDDIKAIDEYCRKAQLDFKELISEEIKQRADYDTRQAPLFEPTINEIKERLTEINQRKAEEKNAPNKKSRKKKSSAKLSISSEQDQAYLDAVESNDMETAQKMVDEAAAANGYTLRKFHQTGNRFNVFDLSRGDHSGGELLFPYGIFTKNTDKKIGLKGDIQMELYVNPGNTLHVKNRDEFKSLLPNEYSELLSQYKALDSLDKDIEPTADALIEAEEKYLAAHPEEEYTDSIILSQTTFDDPECKRLLAEYRGMLDRMSELESARNFKAREYVTDWMRENGYDSIDVEIDKGRHRDQETDAFIVLDNTRVKLTDAVTYDDQGNVIPLSERFNSGNEDVRYSISAENIEDAVGIDITDKEDGYGVENVEDLSIPQIDWLLKKCDTEITKGEPTKNTYTVQTGLARLKTWKNNPSDELFANAKKAYGTTDDFYKSGYILPDGTMLDMSAGGNKRTFQHYEIRDIIKTTPYDFMNASYTVDFFVAKGAVRIDTDSDGIQIPHDGITEAQLDTLRDYFEKYVKSENFDFSTYLYVEATYADPYNSWSKSTKLDPTNEDRFINTLKKYNRDGEFLPDYNAFGTRWSVAEEQEYPYEKDPIIEEPILTGKERQSVIDAKNKASGDNKSFVHIGEDQAKANVKYSLAEIRDDLFDTSTPAFTDQFGNSLYVTPGDKKAWSPSTFTDKEGNRVLATISSYINGNITDKNGNALPIFGETEENEENHKTANTSTLDTYNKLFSYLKSEFPDTWQNLRVLDASSGLGLGTKLGRNLGFDVTDIEPYWSPVKYGFSKNDIYGKDSEKKEVVVLPADASHVEETKQIVFDKNGKQKEKVVKVTVPDTKTAPMYDDYSKLYGEVKSGKVKGFDFIISNAVINVCCQNDRDDLVATMYSLLNEGGRLYINTMGQTYNNNNIKNESNTVVVPIGINNGDEVFVMQTKTIQKAFSKSELKEYVSDVIRSSTDSYFRIKAADDRIKGMNAVVVTKLSEQSPDKWKKRIKSMNEIDTSGYTEEQINRFSYNNNQNVVGSRLVTTNGGTEIRRFGGTKENGYSDGVGKAVGKQIYFHKNYITEVIPNSDHVRQAEEALSKYDPTFEYNCVMYDSSKDVIRFDEAPDFDSAREPIPGRQISIDSNGNIIRDRWSGDIWHHKWLWVKNDYTGFDVEDSWNWSKLYLNTIHTVPVSDYQFSNNKTGREGKKGSFAQGGIADANIWDEQLDYFNLPIDDKASKFSISDEQDSDNIVSLKDNPDIRYSVSTDDYLSELTDEELDALIDSSENNYAPVFYSYMNKVVDEIKQPKLGASSVVSYLKGKGVKNEEIKWSGIEQFLEGKKSVTKEELQEFVKANELQIEEEGTRPNEGVDSFVENIREVYNFSDDEIGNFFIGYDIGRTPSSYNFNLTQYSSDLLRLNKDGVLSIDDVTTLFEIGDDFSKSHKGNRWVNYVTEGASNYREIRFKLPESEYSNQAMLAHWGDSGILVHARIDDQMTDAGEPVLFVEEIQSDWHNAGKKNGYRDKTSEEVIAGLSNELSALLEEEAQVYREYYDVDDFENLDFTNHEDLDKKLYPIRKKRLALRDEIETEYKKAENGETPVLDAPFKDTYTDFVLKRLLRMAAEESYDKLGWTTAQQQIDRWSDEFAEGYRIEYDQDIPKFLKKYGKQWGATVGQEKLKNGETVWTMPVTDAMKDDVLYKGQTRFSMAGTSSVGNSQMFYDRVAAEAMEREGTDSENIRLATGWFKGYDGKWRYEIDDSGTKIADFFVQDSPEDMAKEALKPVNELKAEKDALEAEYKSVFESTRLSKEAKLKKQREIMDSINEVSKKIRKQADFVRRAEANSLFLSDVLKHPKLFKAYPQLKTLSVGIMPPDGGVLGRHAYGHIDIVTKDQSADDIISTIMHEVQHEIQTIEGFAKGSSAEYWRKQGFEKDSAYQNALSILENLTKQLKAVPYDGDDEINDPPFVAYNYAYYKKQLSKDTRAGIKSDVDFDKYIITKYEKLADKGGYRELMNQYLIASQNVDIARMEAENRVNAYDLYHRTAGEVEARDVEHRLNLPKKERQNTRPDIDRTDVVFAEGKYSLSESQVEALDENFNGVLIDEFGTETFSPEFANQFAASTSLLEDDSIFRTADDTTFVPMDDGSIMTIPFDPNSEEVRYIERLKNNDNTNSERTHTIPRANRNEDRGYSLGQQDAGVRAGENRLSQINQENALRTGRSAGEVREENQPQTQKQKGLIPSKYSLSEDNDNTGGTFSDFYNFGEEETNNGIDEAIYEAERIDGTEVTEDSDRNDFVGKFPIYSSEEAIYEYIKNGDVAKLENEINRLLEKSPNVATEAVRRIDERIADEPKMTPEEKAALQKAWNKFLKDYGFIEKGERAKNDIQVPKKARFTEKRKVGKKTINVNVTKNVSKAERTVMENSPEWLNDQLMRELLTNEIGAYTATTNAKDMEYARGYFADHGYKRALDHWNDVVESEGIPTSHDIAIAEQLLADAVAQGHLEDAKRIVADLCALAPRLGQAVQAYRMLKLTGPTGNLYYLNRVVGRLNKEYEKRIASGKMNKVTLDGELVARLMGAQTQEELNKAMEEIKQDLANQIPMTFMDRVNSWRYMMMLNNPPTHIRNFLGNAMFNPVVGFKNMMEYNLERLGGNNVRTRGSLLTNKNSAYYKFAEGDFNDMVDVIMGKSGKYVDINEIKKLRRDMFGSDDNAVSKTMNDLWKKLGDINANASVLGIPLGLENGDMVFLKGYYQSALSQYLEAKGVDQSNLDWLYTDREGKKLLNQARSWAVREAQRNTYRAFNSFASKLSQMKNGGGIGSILIDGVVPFTSTPMNILKRGVEYSPVGLIDGIVSWYKAKNLKDEFADKDRAISEAIDKTASGVTGTAIVMLGVLLASLGMLRGTGSDDDDEAAFEKLQGHQDYSIEIGNTSYTIDWLAPAAIPLFFGEALYKVCTGKGLGINNFEDIIGALFNPLTNLTMLSGINSTLGSLAYAEENKTFQTLFLSGLSSYAGQFMPTILGQVTRTVDPVRRTTYIDQNSKIPSGIQSFVQKSIYGKIPGLSEKRTEYVDAWGRNDTTEPLLRRLFENFLSPGYISTINTTAVDAEIADLYSRTKSSAILPKTQDKKFNVRDENGELVNLDLTAKEYETLSKEAGQEAYNILSNMFNTAEYAAMDDADKIKAISLAYEYARNIGRSETSDRYELAESWMEDAMNTDPVSYIMIKGELTDAGSVWDKAKLILDDPNFTSDHKAYLLSQEFDSPYTVASDTTGYNLVLTDGDREYAEELYQDVYFPQVLEKLMAKDSWKKAYENGDEETLQNLYSDCRSEAKELVSKKLAEELALSGRELKLASAGSMKVSEACTILRTDANAGSDWFASLYTAESQLDDPDNIGYIFELDRYQKEEAKELFKERFAEAYQELCNTESYKSADDIYKDADIRDVYDRVTDEVNEEYAQLLKASGIQPVLADSNDLNYEQRYHVLATTTMSTEEALSFLATVYKGGTTINKKTLTWEQKQYRKECYYDIMKNGNGSLPSLSEKLASIANYSYEQKTKALEKYHKKVYEATSPLVIAKYNL